MAQTSLGHRLKLLRVERQLSLRQAAVCAGVVKETISDIERGVTHPQDVTLAKLAKAYGVPVEDLLEKEPLLLSLEELHAEAECETDWLVKSEEEWREAWEEISSRPTEEAPREAVMAVFDLGDEYSAVRKRIAEQDPDLVLPHILTSGPYKQAFVRWIYGLQNARFYGVAAGMIGIADTLDDLVKELGLVDEMRRREEKRKERGAESLEGMPLAS
jgi:transcriptional regulator with XRE-family HTH domain